jgi:hypothetical protein
MGRPTNTERRDVGFDLVAVLRIGEQRAGDKGAERRRQPGCFHDQRDAHHREQCRCRHGLAHACRRNQPEDPAEQKPPDQDDADDRGDRKGRGTQIHGRTLRTPSGEQRHERNERDGGQVLEQQHGKGEPSVARIDLASFLEHLQREGRG